MAEINPRTALHDSQLEAVLDSLLTDITAIRTTLAGIKSGSSTLNPASANDGAGETAVITVTGASLGDFVLASFSLDLQDFLIAGYVQATDTVEVRLQNESGSTVDLASGTLRVRVIPQASFAAPAALTTTT